MPASWWKRLVRDRLAIGLAAGFVALWTAHAIAMATRPDDALEAYRNDVFWPADCYLTVAQPGRALQMFGHFMLTVVGGLVVAAVLVGLLRLVGRARGAAIGAPVFVVMLLYGFLELRAIPEVVTVVDADAHALRVTRFHPVVPIPSSRVLAATEVRAFGARVDRAW